LIVAIDTSAITSLIADAGVAGASVGGAVLLALVSIKVFRWLRGALDTNWEHNDPDGFSSDD
jgi:hypothetical protein